jgi:hypothetical protein
MRDDITEDQEETLFEDRIKDMLRGRYAMSNRRRDPMWTLNQMRDYLSGVFNPEGGGYDYATVLAKGIDKLPGAVDPVTGHGGSLDPFTGMVLKGILGESFHKTLETEEENDAEIVKDIISGRYFARPRSPWRI